MVTTIRSIQLSKAKSGLSEVVRTVRRTGESVIITVDGEPAAQIAPVEATPRRLTPSEVAAVHALTEALLRIPRPSDPFDAGLLVAEGRR